jgi:Icc-related predicted phosphoesterase
MRTLSWLLAFLVGGSVPVAAGTDPVDDPDVLDSYPKPDTPYYNYLKERRSECIGDGKELDQPVEMEIGKRKYQYTGPALTLVGADPDGVVTLGVLGAIKDFGDESRAAIGEYLDRFEKEKVDALLLLGDIAESEYELTQILLLCAKRGWPVLTIIGNSESRAAYNRAILAALKAAGNIINMDFVRRVGLGGATLISIPGYLDRRFVHQTSGCTYNKRDIKRVKKYLEGVDGPVVLASHGPPRGSGSKALDYAAEGGNVGDTLIADLMTRHKIAFGIFSHILEAGGQTDDGQGKPVAPDKYVDGLRINVGSANPLAWQLTSGKLSCCMGAVFRVKEGKASYTLISRSCK